MFRVAEVADRLTISAATVYAPVACGRLKCHRVGMGRGSIRISAEQLAEYLAAAEPTARPAPPPSPGREVRLKHLRHG